MYPFFWIVSMYIVYHWSADSMHPYMDLKRHRYRTFWPLSYLILALCYGFISHMISTKRPRKFHKIVFPSGILACKYSPGTSNVATYLSSYISIINVLNSVLIITVIGAILSPSIKCRFCLLPFAHVIPFIFPYLFSLLYLPHPATFLSELDSTYVLIAAIALFTGMMP